MSHNFHWNLPEAGAVYTTVTLIPALLAFDWKLASSSQQTKLCQNNSRVWSCWVYSRFEVDFLSKAVSFQLSSQQHLQSCCEEWLLLPMKDKTLTIYSQQRMKQTSSSKQRWSIVAVLLLLLLFTLFQIFTFSKCQRYLGQEEGWAKPCADVQVLRLSIPWWEIRISIGAQLCLWARRKFGWCSGLSSGELLGCPGSWF